MKNWKIILIGGAVVVALVLMCVVGVQSSQNKAIRLEEQLETSNSDIRVQEKKRVDLVYNLADVIKEYDKHESDVLKNIADSRKGSAVTGVGDEVRTKIAAVAEAYPELKSRGNYKELMLELTSLENQISQYRENYNKDVKSYNAYVRKFPTRIFLSMTGYEVVEYSRLDFGAPSDAPQNLFRR